MQLIAIEPAREHVTSIMEVHPKRSIDTKAFRNICFGNIRAVPSIDDLEGTFTFTESGAARDRAVMTDLRLRKAEYGASGTATWALLQRKRDS